MIKMVKFMSQVFYHNTYFFFTFKILFIYF